MSKAEVLGKLAMAAGAAAVAARNFKRHNMQGTGPAVGPSTARNAKFRLRNRHRTGTAVREKPDKDTSQNAEYVRETVARGRKPKQTLRAAWKMLNANKSSVVFGVRQYSQYGASQGQIALQNQAATLDSTWTPPCVLYDVTSCINDIGGVATAAAPGVKPIFSNMRDTATISWSSGGMSSWTLDTSDAPNSVQESYPMGSSMLDWMKAQLLFYSTTTLPTRVQVDLVQITDTRLVPGAESTPFATAFWQSAIKRFAYSPLEPGNNQYKKYLKTLYTKSFILEPKETTESVPAQLYQLDLFQRFNRKCTYNWQNADRMNINAVEGPVNRADNQNVVHPRARIFLMIRAQSKSDTAYTTTVHPSYDIVLRTKHTQLSQ